MRVRCFGYNLDLAINKGLNDLIHKLSVEGVSSFSYSCKRQKELKEAPWQNNWATREEVERGSNHKMEIKGENMQRIMEQQDDIWMVLSQDRKVFHLHSLGKTSMSYN